MSNIESEIESINRCLNKLENKIDATTLESIRKDTDKIADHTYNIDKFRLDSIERCLDKIENNTFKVASRTRTIEWLLFFLHIYYSVYLFRHWGL